MRMRTLHLQFYVINFECCCFVSLSRVICFSHQSLAFYLCFCYKLFITVAIVVVVVGFEFTSLSIKNTPS